MNTERTFEEIKKNRLFWMNGNDYVKQSSRTGRMLSNGRIFYFRKQDQVRPISY